MYTSTATGASCKYNGRAVRFDSADSVFCAGPYNRVCALWNRYPRGLCPEDRIVHNDNNACTMITDSAVNTIRYGSQLPRLEKSNRNVVYNNTPIVATNTNIINDGESRAPRRRSSDSRTSPSGACGTTTGPAPTSASTSESTSESTRSRDIEIAPPQEGQGRLGSKERFGLSG